MPRDYYEVVGVPRAASQDEIKKAYRRLAMRYHPDRNAGAADAEKKLKELNEANDVLADPEKRALYDRFGFDGPRAAGRAQQGGGFHTENVDLGDIFSSVFGDGGGGRHRRHQPQGGRDLHITLRVDLEQAVRGGTQEVRIPTRVACDDCKGSGSSKGAAPGTCPDCGGQGEVGSRMGFFSVRQTCSRCSGSGEVISDPCRRCGGQGLRSSEQTIKIKIPAGVDNDDRLKMSGKGEQGAHGTPPGDLYVSIEMLEHPLFKRRDEDLFCETPVDFATLVLGGEQEVPTLDGPVQVKVPAGTQTGKNLRLRGKGVRALRSGRQGDLFCRVVLETPVKLNAEQRELLRKFQDSMNRESNLPKSERWLNKAKEFFNNIRNAKA